MAAALLLSPLSASAKADNATPPERTPLFNAESFMLDNGMQVVVIPNHRIPVVTHMVWYYTGGADEPRGKTGVAHLMEHMMFKGSSNVPTGEFSTRVKTLGGQDNAFTSLDFTAYFQSVPARHLETVMRMEADRMQSLLMPEDHVISERDVVIQERKQVTENNPRAHFAEHLNTAAFINHPYGRPVIGWMQEIKNINRDDLMDFHDKHYAPNNAILVVSGDITAEQLKALATEIYGAIPPKEIAQRDWTDIPVVVGDVEMHHSDPRIRQNSVMKIARAPSFRQDKTAALSLQLLETILSDGSNSRLYKSLVVDQKIASNVSMSYNGSTWEDGKIWLSATPNDGFTNKQATDALMYELNKISQNGVTDTELSEAKTRLTESAIFARDSLSGPAMIVGRALITGSSLDDVEYWAYDLNNITAQDLQNTAERYLNENNNPFVTGHLSPAIVKEEDQVQ